MPTLIVATGNPGKVREFDRFFNTLSETESRWQLQPKPADLDIEETGTTFADNALQKARGVAVATQQWAIADDSGLSVRALDGAPGVYSARYADSDPARIARLLQELEGTTDRKAEFVCAIALCNPGGEAIAQVDASCPGVILQKTQGNGGFGYDPIFYVPDAQLSFAEMSIDQKQQWGHRGRALRLLSQQLQQLDLS
ncbi:MAG: RdgB/HAM1 family non-canonical purine NTP pyrophosphatase [Cyanobacteria bacterium J06648_11]